VSTGAPPSSGDSFLAVERGRHHQDAQVVAQHLLHLAAQGQGQVGVQAAFVKLVEDHHSDALQRVVALATAG
jgi:hypothetical protein